MSLKILWKKFQVLENAPEWIIANCFPVTDKTVSDQVEKTTFEQQITRQCGRVVKVTVQHRQPGDPQFDSWKSKKIDFSNFQLISRDDILVEPGQARPDCLDLAIIASWTCWVGK